MIDQITNGLRFYQSANADATSIKEDFIIRIEEFDIIMDDIRRNLMKGAVQHYLLLGRRGSGKSTLLKRLQVEIEQDEVLKQTHIAINPAEEQANIYRLYDLLQEVIDELDDKGIEVVQPEYDDDSNNYARSLFFAIHDAIEKEGKKIVLLLDNIDRIFDNLKEDQTVVRELLLNFDDIKIIGGSTKMTEHFWKHDLPFYQFFRIMELKPLTIDEIKALLLMWSEKFNLQQLATFVKERTGQLETVRRLTDGLPRTLQFFVNVLINHTQETGYEYLRRIMDQVTPLYQERLNNLPAPQRKIVLQMAFLWEAAGAGEIAQATHMANNLISAQLKQLINKEIVEKIPTDTKNNLYRLSERFFNLWLIFTQGSQKEKRKAKCLTIFLESFYSADDLKIMADGHLRCLADMEPGKAAILTKAYAQSKYISSEMRDELLNKTLQLNISDDLRSQLPVTTDKIVKKINEFVNKQLWDKAITEAYEIDQEDGLKDNALGLIYVRKGDTTSAEKCFLKATEKGNIKAIFNLALLYENQQQKYDLAEKYYLLAIEKGELDSLNNLAVLYSKLKKHDLSEKYFLLAIDKGYSNAMNSLAGIYFSEQKFDLAEEYFLLAIKKGNVDAIFNLGLVYAAQRKYKDAEKYYLEAIEKGLMEATNNLAALYADQKKYAKAEKYYLLAMEKGEVYAINNLGLLYDEEGKYDQAEKYYLNAIEKGIPDAFGNLAATYARQGKYDLAEKYYLHAIDEGDVIAIFNLALFYYFNGINKSKAFELINNSKELGEKNDGLDTLWIVINIWNGNIAGMQDELRKVIKNKQERYIATTFENLLYHYQINMVNELFEDPEFGESLIEQYQPIYYAVRLLIGKNHNLELKIPPEIKGTVDEILSRVKEKQEFYYRKGKR